MDLKKMTLASLFLALGLILHQVMPPLLFGMKPDIMLCMMFIILILNRGDYKMTLVVGILAGLFSALTSTFPGGQMPNMIDKFITANFIFLLYKFSGSKIKDQLQILIASIFGTLLSGVVFLGSAALLVGLPGSFTALMAAVVIPAVVMNAVLCTILYNAVVVSLRRINKAY